MILQLDIRNKFLQEEKRFRLNPDVYLPSDKRYKDTNLHSYDPPAYWEQYFLIDKIDGLGIEGLHLLDYKNSSSESNSYKYVDLPSRTIDIQGYFNPSILGKTSFDNIKKDFYKFFTLNAKYILYFTNDDAVYNKITEDIENVYSIESRLSDLTFDTFSDSSRFSRFSISMICDNPYFKLDKRSVYKDSDLSSIGGVKTLANISPTASYQLQSMYYDGSIPTGFRFTAKGFNSKDLGKLQIFNHTDQSMIIDFNRLPSVYPAYMLFIDTRNPKSIKYGYGTSESLANNAIDSFDINSDWLKMTPGYNNFKVRFSGSSTSSITLDWDIYYPTLYGGIS